MPPVITGYDMKVALAAEHAARTARDGKMSELRRGHTRTHAALSEDDRYRSAIGLREKEVSGVAALSQLDQHLL